MGWYCGPEPREELIDELTSSTHAYTCLAHAERNEGVQAVLWSAWESTEGDRAIRCDLLDNGPHGWGHKPMDEMCHPYYYSCPVKILALVPPVCEKWRAGCDEWQREHGRAATA